MRSKVAKKIYNETPRSVKGWVKKYVKKLLKINTMTLAERERIEREAEEYVPSSKQQPQQSESKQP